MKGRGLRKMIRYFRYLRIKDRRNNRHRGLTDTDISNLEKNGRLW